jgi:hypothetical protein
LLLESSKCAGSLKRLIRRIEGIERASTFDETVHAPIRANGVFMPGAAIDSGNQRKHAPISVGFAFNLLREVCRDPLNVLHERDGAGEDAGVHSLQEKAKRLACLSNNDTPGFIDVSAAEGLSRNEFTRNLKLANDTPDLAARAHDQSFRG